MKSLTVIKTIFQTIVKKTQTGKHFDKLSFIFLKLVLITSKLHLQELQHSVKVHNKPKLLQTRCTSNLLLLSSFLVF